MATTFIPIDDQKPLGRNLVRGMSQLRDGMEGIQHALATFVTMVDGNGSDAAQFGVAVTEGTFLTNAAAKASWDEIQSLNAVVANASAAILQACAKHGIGG